MTSNDTNASAGLVLVIAVQLLCAAFFLSDVVYDGLAGAWRAPLQSEFTLEALATCALIAAVVIETRMLLALLRRKAHLERQVGIAAGALHDIILAHFQRWALTPSEQDVALFTIKGLTITEIAALRGSAEGTVKSHLNAIYRKAGITGRGALLSLLIEDLMETPLLAREAPDSSAAPGPGLRDHP